LSRIRCFRKKRRRQDTLKTFSKIKGNNRLYIGIIKGNAKLCTHHENRGRRLKQYRGMMLQLRGCLNNPVQSGSSQNACSLFRIAKLRLTRQFCNLGSYRPDQNQASAGGNPANQSRQTSLCESSTLSTPKQEKHSVTRQER
jgi:hypothetical protein